jgi:hypothetical protein
MQPDSDDPEARPWILLVLAGVLVWVCLETLDDREVAVGSLGAAAFCAALFFLPDLREFMSRWPWRD